jgi:VanZ family protein
LKRRRRCKRIQYCHSGSIKLEQIGCERKGTALRCGLYAIVALHMPLLHALIDTKYAALRLRAAWAIYLSVLLFGAIPGARAEVGEYASGLVLHFVTYGCITFLLFTGFFGQPALNATRCILLIACMGGVDEFMQSFLPYRRGALLDWYVDMAAGLCVATLLWAASPKLQALQAALKK